MVITELDALRAELRALLSSWEYAFAMVHGCSLGDQSGLSGHATESRRAARGSTSTAPDPAYRGVMFWLRRKTFVGS